MIKIFKRLKTWYIKTLNGLMEVDAEEASERPVPKRYPVNLYIGEETLTLNVTEDSEASFRMAAKRLDDDYKRFSQNYPETTPERLYALLALKEALSQNDKS